MKNKQWAPSQEENLGVITSVYEFIKEELSELQKETGCPDSFIYDFIGKIQIMIIRILGIVLIIGTIAYYGLVLTGQSNL